MVKDNLCFEEVTTKEDFLTLLEKATDSNSSYHYAYLEVAIFLNEKVLSTALSNIKSFTDEEERRFLDLVKTIDKEMVTDRKQKNMTHKLMSIISGCLYIKDKNYQDYKSKALALLAKYSCYEDISFYKDAYKKYSKEVLDSVISKTKDYMIQENLLLVVEKLYEEKKEVEEVISYLERNDLKLLLQEAFIYEEKLVGEYSDNRRI